MDVMATAGLLRDRRRDGHETPNQGRQEFKEWVEENTGFNTGFNGLRKQLKAQHKET